MDYFSGILLPAVLIGTGLFFAWRLHFFWVLHPLRTWNTLCSAAGGGGTSPFAALSMALAGTLGVGNIAGVATAITAGGAGAVLWMLLGALAAMGVKYAEVYLAVRYRRTRTVDGKTEYYGGAMYYIRDGIYSHARSAWGRKCASLLGCGFALLCVLNALLTGNLVQVRTAVGCVPLPPLCFGILFAAAAWLCSRRGTARIASAAAVLIPLLAGLFITLSCAILLSYRAQIPAILRTIWQQAWDFRPAAGGFLGLGVSRAVRYGITRGIFSNEAGCGTAPTAHASAIVKSPHHQGCYGIFEVFVDTVLLCSLTALVILLYADGEGLDGIELSVTAYTRLAEKIGGAVFARSVNLILRVSIVLFAFATAVCQSCYGTEAIRYFTSGRIARTAYRICSTVVILIGCVLPTGFMWQCADAVVTVMTLSNAFCLLYLRREVR